MKGWQNQVVIEQKINCSKDILSKISAFEQCEYIDNTNEGFIGCNIPISDCCSLRHLIDSLKLNFLKIYKGQVLTISYEILQHLIQLHSNNLGQLSHGQLEPQNIYISLKPLKNNRFTIYQVPIYIKKINFINYKGIDDENYQVNQIADIQQIINSLQEFIQSIEDYQQCQLLQLINNQLQQINNNINQNSLSELCQFFNQLITNHVDQQAQQIKKGQYKESPNYVSTFGYRYRFEKVIINYLDQLSVWDLYYRIEIQMNNNLNLYSIEPAIYQNQTILFEDQNSNEKVQIKRILSNSLRNTIILQFWTIFGQKLKSWPFGNQVFQEFQNKANNNLSQLPNWVQRIKQTLIQCQNEIPKQITDQIQQQFKFEFEINQDIKNRIAQIFFQQLLIQFQSFDLFEGDRNKQLQLIRQSIEKEVTKYYQQQTLVKISKMTLQLI